MSCNIYALSTKNFGESLPTIKELPVDQIISENWTKTYP
jgi:hypothetical protein